MSVTTTSESIVNDPNNIVDIITNEEGDLYLKYFLIDSSFNTRGWSVDSSQIERLAKQAIGKPFTDYEDFPDTLYNDQHPWNPKPKATYEDHLQYAKDKATGFVVDFSPVSKNALKSASGNEIQLNNGYYVTVKVTNEEKKKLYKQHPERIPRVSPGIYDYDLSDLPAKNLKNIDIVHLAGVKYGAYGEKARLYAKCSGGYECVNHLKGASNLQLKEKEQEVSRILSKLGEKGASNVDLNNSSLGEKTTNYSSDNIMVENNTIPTNIDTNSNNAALSDSPNINQPINQIDDNNNNKEVEREETKTTNEVVKEETEVKDNNNNKEASGTKQSNPLRLKSQLEKQIKETKQNVPDWKNDPELKRLMKEHEELKKKADFEEAKKKYSEVIPRELFILNGKFDINGYNKELEKAVKKGLDLDYAKEFYELKLKNIQIHNKLGRPYGASNYNNDAIVESANTNNNSIGYETPNNVPELKGASDSFNSSQFTGLRNICKMFNLNGGF